MANSLKVLDDNRDALLLAEVGAWLHMFGKLHEDFLKGHHELDTEIPAGVPKELSDLLRDGTWTGNIWNKLPIKDFRASGLSIYNLIKRHRPLRKGSEGFIQLMADAHGRGSGIEKGILNRFAPTQEIVVYLSTSLGHEADTSIDLNAIHHSRQLLYDFLLVQLATLRSRNAKLKSDEWVHFRHDFIQRIIDSFGVTVAETRRPFNDVTLLDQTAISIAFFKAALAQNLLQGKWKEPSQDKVADQYRWRLLRVGLEGLAFWGNSTRVGDLLARKGIIEGTLDKVQALLEIEYPLGAEIYRDESGSIFIVPDIADLLACTDGFQSLEQRIQAIADKEFSSETQFTLFLSDSTRDALVFGELATRSLPWPGPQFVWLQQEWQSKERDVCPVCGLRPQGPGRKALRRKVCDVCEERRSDRSKEWIRDPATTIWIDEVADWHGQLVLLVARFDIVDWLYGSSFNTVVSFDPQSRRLSDKKYKSSDYDFDLQVLNNDIQKGLKPGQKFEDNLLDHLVVKDARGGSDFVGDFYDLRVTQTDIGTVSPTPKPELLTLSLIRQPPSFARIRRTWETVKAFWEEIESGFKNSIGEVGTRIKIGGTFVPITNNLNRPIIAHTYELKLGTVNLSVTCAKEGEFLTVDNLRRVAVLMGASEESSENYSTSAHYVFDRIQSETKAGRVFAIEEPTGYGDPNRTLGTLEITEISLEQRFNYFPAITILTEPRTFMALVPAEKAWNVVRAIKDKYEKELGKVRNRLPLAMGIVFAGRRTPLPAILDAGRRMLKQPIQDECWIIERVDQSSLSGKVGLTLKRNEYSLKIRMPTVMGDDTTEDAWYPYWCVERDQGGNKPAARRRQFTGLNGKEWVHICDLREGDMVHMMPSRVDFEFLDTAARRFEVSYEDGKRRGTSRPARPYYLEQLDDFEQLWAILSDRLATSQIDTLVGVIKTKREEWLAKQDDSTFQGIVHDVLNNANWRMPLNSNEFQQLVHAAISGQLADVVELYITILKNPTRVDSIGGNK